MDKERISLLWEEFQKGSDTARKELVLANMGLVRNVVQRFLKWGHDSEELCQIGTIGLMKAIDHFEMEKGFQFSTYAVPVIMGEIRRFLRDDGTIHISRSLRENSFRIAKVAEGLCQKFGRQPKIEELAEETGLSREEVVLALGACERVESADEVMYEGERNVTRLEYFTNGKNEMEAVENKLFLEGIFSGLSEEEKELLKYRYYEDLTQTETAKRMHLNQVRISRMEKKILEKIRRIATRT